MNENLLLDTCALIWGASGETLAKGAVEAILGAESRGDDIFFSPISAWEIGLLVRRERLRLAGRPGRWFTAATEEKGLKPCPLTPELLIESSFLPGELHGDPADRILIATAREYDLRIVTRDRRILDYAALGEVKALPC